MLTVHTSCLYHATCDLRLSTCDLTNDLLLQRCAIPIRYPVPTRLSSTTPPDVTFAKHLLVGPDPILELSKGEPAREGNHESYHQPVWRHRRRDARGRSHRGRHRLRPRRHHHQD